ncbi:hypothetical protein JCM8097_001830 [Rhodosporidiobolus ruineniae]
MDSLRDVAFPDGREQTSTAGSLSYDVLLKVFHFVPVVPVTRDEHEPVAWVATSSDLTVQGLSLVCRAWRAPGQVTLFRAINLYTASAARLFIRTVDAVPSLARQVKAATITLELEEHEVLEDSPEVLEQSRLLAVALKRCTNVQHASIGPIHHLVLLGVLEYLASLPLRSLFLKLSDHHATLTDLTGLHVYQTFHELFARLDKLTALELDFAPPISLNADELFPLLPYTSQITRLRYIVQGTPDFLAVFLQSLPLLEHLDIFTEFSLDPELSTQAFSTLKHLHKLRLHSDAPPEHDNRWLVRLIPTFHRLEVLSVTAGAVLNVDRLPAFPLSLKVLEILDQTHSVGWTVACLERLAFEGPRIGEPPFLVTKVRAVVDRRAFAAAVLEEIVECMEARWERTGVDFEVVEEMPPLEEEVRVVELD